MSKCCVCQQRYSLFVVMNTRQREEYTSKSDLKDKRDFLRETYREYAHLECLIFFEGIQIIQEKYHGKQDMVVFGLEHIHAQKSYQYECQKCSETDVTRACIRCMVSGCRKAYHVRCMIDCKKRLLCYQNKLHVYCNEHFMKHRDKMQQLDFSDWPKFVDAQIARKVNLIIDNDAQLPGVIFDVQVILSEEFQRLDPKTKELNKKIKPQSSVLQPKPKRKPLKQKQPVVPEQVSIFKPKPEFQIDYSLKQIDPNPTPIRKPNMSEQIILEDDGYKVSYIEKIVKKPKLDEVVKDTKLKAFFAKSEKQTSQYVDEEEEFINKFKKAQISTNPAQQNSIDQMLSFVKNQKAKQPIPQQETQDKINEESGLSIETQAPDIKSLEHQYKLQKQFEQERLKDKQKALEYRRQEEEEKVRLEQRSQYEAMEQEITIDKAVNLQFGDKNMEEEYLNYKQTLIRQKLEQKQIKSTNEQVTNQAPKDTLIQKSQSLIKKSRVIHKQRDNPPRTRIQQFIMEDVDSDDPMQQHEEMMKQKRRSRQQAERVEKLSTVEPKEQQTLMNPNDLLRYVLRPRQQRSLPVAQIEAEERDVNDYAKLSGQLSLYPTGEIVDEEAVKKWWDLIEKEYFSIPTMDTLQKIQNFKIPLEQEEGDLIRVVIDRKFIVDFEVTDELGVSVKQTNGNLQILNHQLQEVSQEQQPGQLLPQLKINSIYQIEKEDYQTMLRDQTQINRSPYIEDYEKHLIQELSNMAIDIKYDHKPNPTFSNEWQDALHWYSIYKGVKKGFMDKTQQSHHQSQLDKIACNPKLQFPDPEDTFCMVCLDYHREPESIRNIMYCVLCWATFHKDCYNFTDSQQKCDRCRVTPIEPICAICHQQYSNLPLKIIDDKMYHVQCALLNNQLQVKNGQFTIQRAFTYESDSACVVCNEQSGMKIKCKQCLEEAHLLCAYLHGLKVMITSQDNIPHPIISVNILCPRHNQMNKSELELQIYWRQHGINYNHAAQSKSFNDFVKEKLTVIKSYTKVLKWAQIV